MVVAKKEHDMLKKNFQGVTNCCKLEALPRALDMTQIQVHCLLKECWAPKGVLDPIRLTWTYTRNPKKVGPSGPGRSCAGHALQGRGDPGLHGRRENRPPGFLGMRV